MSTTIHKVELKRGVSSPSILFKLVHPTSPPWTLLCIPDDHSCSLMKSLWVLCAILHRPLSLFGKHMHTFAHTFIYSTHSITTHTHTHTSITRDTTDMVDDPDNMPESQFRFWWYERIVAYNLIHLDLNCKLWEMPLKKPPKESAAKEYITVSVLTEMLKQQKVFFKDPRNKTSKRFYNYSWRQQTSESMTL